MWHKWFPSQCCSLQQVQEDLKISLCFQGKTFNFEAENPNVIQHPSVPWEKVKEAIQQQVADGELEPAEYSDRNFIILIMHI